MELLPWILDCEPHRCFKSGWSLPFFSFRWTLCRSWNNLGVGISLVGPESGIPLRKSVRIFIQYVWVYRQCQGVYWSFLLCNFIQRSWGCWISPAPVQSPLARWHNVPDHPAGATTLRWACSAWVWDFSLGILWGVGVNLPPSFICAFPSVPCL